jgi:phosphatidylinositol alpha-mannosyltransferase
MKIALVSPYDFATPGGVVSHISCLEKQFTKMGHEVKIIAPASAAVYTLGDRFIRIGTPRPVPVSGSVARITLGIHDNDIKEVFAREKFDICHLHEPLMPTLCTAILRLKRSPMVGTFHASGGKPWYTMFSPVMKWYLDRWFRKLDGRICVSEVAWRYVSPFFPAEYTIIPNGVDTCHFNCNTPRLDNFNDGKLNILFVGRLEKRKGFDYLLEAYRMIKPEFPECRLIQVGPGTVRRRKYEKIVNRYHIPDVFFSGYATYDDLPRYYQTSDITCFPSTGRESQGIVLLEAMSVGKPVIASNIDGYNSVLTDGVEGIAVPPKDAVRLAVAISRLIQDKQLREQMGERGKPNALKYEWSAIAKRLVDFYTATLNKINKAGPDTGKTGPEIKPVSGT